MREYLLHGKELPKWSSRDDEDAEVQQMSRDQAIYQLAENDDDAEAEWKVVVSLKKRIDQLARALALTPTSATTLFQELRGRRRWWLVGCAEGDQALPQTAGAPTVEQALVNAEGWLAPELGEKGEKVPGGEH